MNNAVWLILALPEWYFSALMVPFSLGMLSLAPSIGALALAVGVILGFVKRTRRLLFFAVPLLLSELLVGVAGALRGNVDASQANIVLLLFLAAQVMGAGYLVYKLRGVWPAAIALAIFSVSYAFFAAFVAGMSFTDSWL
jgi:hypothetical protein